MTVTPVVLVLLFGVTIALVVVAVVPTVLVWFIMRRVILLQQDRIRELEEQVRSNNGKVR